MVGLSDLMAYVVVVCGLLLIPGPAVLLVLARATSGGRAVGVATGLGIATGDLVHATLAIFGLSAVLATSALAFDAVKYAGVAYLAWLGLRSLFVRTHPLDMPSVRRIGAGRAFRQAIVTELLNPKTALFFLAFLPQFVRPGDGPAVAQFAELGIVFVVMSALYTALIAVGAGAAGGRLGRHRGVGRWQGRVVGAISLALGIRLAFEGR